MPSPFPGMDPYVEASGQWEGFHDRFIIYFGDLLGEALPRHYWVSVRERITSIGLPDGPTEQYVADLGVSADPGVAPAGGYAAEAVATVEPVAVPLQYREPTRETYLEILRLPERQVVTVLELLSPSNKEQPGREMYHRKREVLLNQFVHLVEIDFLIQGTRLPMRAAVPDGDYYAYVSRAERRPVCDVYAWRVRQRPPVIRVPVRGPDPDLSVDLGALCRQAIDRGRYENVIDYSAEPPAFLRPEDRDWAREVVRQARQPQ
jgi:hypothetical protein